MRGDTYFLRIVARFCCRTKVRRRFFASSFIGGCGSGRVWHEASGGQCWWSRSKQWWIIPSWKRSMPLAARSLAGPESVLMKSMAPLRQLRSVSVYVTSAFLAAAFTMAHNPKKISKVAPCRALLAIVNEWYFYHLILLQGLGALG